MSAPRALLWAPLLVGVLASAPGLAAQSAPDGLGSARGCTRSRIGVTGTVTPVTAESHTFLGRFVGSFSRYVQPNLRDVHGDISIGLGGDAPASVGFSMKRPVSLPLLPEQREDRLAPEQHRALFTGIKSALSEIQGVPDAGFSIALRLEGRC
jgi:hypothetical protein